LLLSVPFAAFFGLDAITLDRTVSASQFRAFVIGATMLGNFDAAGIKEPDRTLLSECPDARTQQKEGYNSRPLHLAALTSPPLPPVSAPTFDNVLKPAARRPNPFFVGCRNYDVNKLGYACDGGSERAFLFDTRLASNGNGGHEFGTDLGDDDRAALLEYIKS